MQCIYTDGSCKKNPGPGGWAFYIPMTKHHESGCDYSTTNNRMELIAIISALKYNNQNVIIKTDSRYVQLGITEWIHKWKMNDWKTANKTDVKNKDLWTLLDSLRNDTVNFEWVKGHSTDEFNCIVDQLAKDALNDLKD